MKHQRRVDRLRLLALALIILGILYFYANLFTPRLIPRSLRIGSLRRPTTLLLLGTDITFDINTGEPIESAQGRTDTILLIRLDPVHYKVNILSIPRDSFVPIPGYGWQKINAANVLGGVPLLKQTITDLTGLQIDNYAEINPFAAVRLVDLIGGMKLYVDKDMYYIDRAQNLNINLKEGWHKLSGREAIGFLRFRHDAMGDLGRIDRQQRFLAALSQNLAKPANLVKAPLALGILNQYIKTDLPLGKTIRLANYLRMTSLRDIRTFTASGEEGTSSYAGSILTPNRQVIERIVKDYFSR